MATYSNSSCERPNEIESGGRGTYCCIPKCGNSQYDRYMQPTKIGLFRFPNEQKYPDWRKSWYSALKPFRRKGGSDSFIVTNSTRVCEFHFLGFGGQREAPRGVSWALSSEQGPKCSKYIYIYIYMSN